MSNAAGRQAIEARPVFGLAEAVANQAPIRVVGARPMCGNRVDDWPPEIAQDIYYIGKHRGRHVLAIYPYVMPEGEKFDLDAWEASQQKVSIPNPVSRRSWRVAYGLAKRIRAWGRGYYEGLATQRELVRVVAEQEGWS